MNITKEIVERPSSQHYWVVRASGGDFVNHFRQAGVMAIGHIDELDLSRERLKPFFPELKPLQVAISNIEKKESRKSSKYRAYNHFNQVKTFIAEIDIGDLVVTIDHGTLCVGRVISYPFENWGQSTVFSNIRQLQPHLTSVGVRHQYSTKTAHQW